MTGEKKFFIGIALVTLVALVVGVSLLSRSSKKPGVKVDEALLVREDSEKISSPSASATLVEFADYQCPACGAYQPVLKQLLSEFDGKLNVVYRNFPLAQHKNARVAAYAAEAAGEQGKFWEMHDKLFDEQREWSEKNNARDLFMQYAKDLGLDADRLAKDIDSEAIVQRVNRDFGDGNSVGVNSTPTFFLNGEKLANPRSYEDFKALVQAAIDKASVRQTQDKPLSQAPMEKYHTHFNLKVILNGEPLDLTLPKYQSTEEKELNPDIHVHDGNGDVVHIHRRGKTLGDFFDSLGISLSSACLKMDNGKEYCSGGKQTLKLFVNGRVNDQFESVEPQDLDRILVTYGSDSDRVVQSEIDSVADTACIYSETCPERGKPPEETCVGGLGSGCDK